MLVGSSIARRYTQRRLAAALDPQARALANVWFFTPFDLAREIANRTDAAPRRPLPDGADVALLSQTLQELGLEGRLKELHPDQPGLSAALTRTLNDLREADIDADEYAAWAGKHGPAAQEVGRIYQRWQTRLAKLPFIDRAGVYRRALDASTTAWREALADAPLIVTGIYDMTRLQRLLIEQAAATVETHFVGLNAEGDDFDFARQALARLSSETGVAAADAPAASPAEDVEITGFSAPDPEAEAEEITRRILELGRAGTRFNEVAIFHRQGAAADRRLSAALERAGLPIYRSRGTPIGWTSDGRAARQLLQLLWQTPTRSLLLELLANPGLSTGVQARPILWERISRSAGLVSDWKRMAGQLRTHQKKKETPEHEQILTAELLTQVERLQFQSELANQTKTWASASTRLLGALDDWLEPPRESEKAAREAVRAAIEGLVPLDELGIPFTGAEFARTVERALGKAAVRDRDPLVKGVFIGDANGAGRAVRFEAIFVAGLAERVMPAVGRQDPLLSDRQRNSLNEFVGVRALRLQSERGESDRFAFGLLRQAARRRCTLSWARRANTVGGPSRPSPLLLTALGGRGGLLAGPEQLTEQGRLQHLTAVLSGTGSAAANSAAPMRALDRADLHLTMLTMPNIEQRTLLPQLWPSSKRALQAKRRRNEDHFTEYDGIIDLGERTDAVPESWSASALQRYATCPYRFFLGNVLRLNAVTEPGDDAEISPLERGHLVHRTLERWVDHWLAESASAEGKGRSWAEYLNDPDPLTEAANHELELAGDSLGAPSSAEATGQKLHRDLHQYREQQRIAAANGRGWAPTGAERELKDVLIEIGPVESITLHGRIDRTDRHADGRRRAIDYKTGRMAKSVLHGHYNGTALQLPLYLHALSKEAEPRGGLAAASAELHYVNERERFGKLTMEGLDFVGESADRDALRQTLTTITHGVRSGRFFPYSGDNPNTRDHCRYCDFAAACSSDVNKRFRFKAQADLPLVKPFKIMRASKPPKTDQGG